MLVIPTFFAGIRYDVGTDYFTYAFDVYRWENTSFIDYFKSLDYIGGTPIGSFVIGKISSSYFALFFLYSVLACFPIAYILVYEYKDYRKSMISFAWLLYLICYYPLSLNIMKQSISCSFVLLGLYFLSKKKQSLYFVTVLIAFLFHQTSLISVPLYFLFNKDGKISKARKKILIIAYSCVIVFINIVLVFIGSDWEEYINSVGTNNLSFYINLVWMCVFLYKYRSLVEYDKRNELLIFAYILGTMFSVMGFWSIYGKRISLYFTICQFVLMSELPYCVKDKGNHRIVVKTALLIYCVALFVISYHIMGQADIIPYSFLINI